MSILWKLGALQAPGPRCGTDQMPRLCQDRIKLAPSLLSPHLAYLEEETWAVNASCQIPVPDNQGTRTTEWCSLCNISRWKLHSLLTPLPYAVKLIWLFPGVCPCHRNHPCYDGLSLRGSYLARNSGMTSKGPGCVLSLSHQASGIVLHMLCRLNEYLTFLEASQDIEYSLQTEGN